MTLLDTRFLSIVEAADLLHKREVSPVELTQSCLDQIDAVDGRLNSFITVTGELALAQAGRLRKALEGLRLTESLSDLRRLRGEPLRARG